MNLGNVRAVTKVYLIKINNDWFRLKLNAWVKKTRRSGYFALAILNILLQLLVGDNQWKF